MGRSTRSWKLLHAPNDEAGGRLNPRDKEWFLANIEADPAERTNLARLHPDLVEQLRKLEPER